MISRSVRSLVAQSSVEPWSSNIASSAFGSFGSRARAVRAAVSASSTTAGASLARTGCERPLFSRASNPHALPLSLWIEIASFNIFAVFSSHAPLRIASPPRLIKSSKRASERLRTSSQPPTPPAAASIATPPQIRRRRLSHPSALPREARSQRSLRIGPVSR